MEDEPYRLEEHTISKSAEERRIILQAIKSNFLFEHTTDKQKKVRVFALFSNSCSLLLLEKSKVPGSTLFSNNLLISVNENGWQTLGFILISSN